ncbi:hypothetical protein A3L09_03705 [Thermococcus profundus]|uniref:Uncharacterized protein n=1 Tax=Thermococcus profundus TaxID=49899 RepID=A0A2Z2M7N4_THEPR|nr:hypothetical protein [Thermococcus profundus]ASJ02420.1 hypothetical protein A3L09_03705 [Thermococcus profundus]
MRRTSLLLPVALALIAVGAVHFLMVYTLEENESSVNSSLEYNISPEALGEAYVYTYHMRGSGFMTPSEDGVGIICPGKFGAFYGVDINRETVFITAENLTNKARRGLRDPYLIVERILKDQRSKVIKEENGTRVLKLYWNTSEKYGPETVVIHHTLRAVFQNGSPVEVYESHTNEIVNDSPSVIVDYVDTRSVYTIRKTYCWPDIFGRNKTVLRWYLELLFKGVSRPS